MSTFSSSVFSSSSNKLFSCSNFDIIHISPVFYLSKSWIVFNSFTKQNFINVLYYFMFYIYKIFFMFEIKYRDEDKISSVSRFFRTINGMQEYLFLCEFLFRQII